MDEFQARQISQMLLGIDDFRKESIELSTFLSRLEGAGRALGQQFWEEELFATALALEQINADLIEERRNMTSQESASAFKLIEDLEQRLSRY